MDDRAPPSPELRLPRLPVRASIYIDPDGNVQFGALFAELVPVARALGSLAGERPAEPEVRGEQE